MGVYKLRGDYVTNVSYHIGLHPKSTLPENTIFIQPDLLTTLAIPSTTTSVYTIASYGENSAAASGNGPNISGNVNKPDIATLREGILTIMLVVELWWLLEVQ